MMHDQRVQRLREMLAQVSGPGGLETLTVPPVPPIPAAPPTEGFSGLQDLRKRPAAPPPEVATDRLQTAIEKLKEGKPISPAEASGLEALVLPDKRPVVYIRNNVFDTVPMAEWQHLNPPAMHQLLEPAFASIGRLELPLAPSIPYAGTGFVVGENLLMTNRHVARLFADGLGSQLTYQSGGSAIDFRKEFGTPDSDTSRVTVTGVLMIHPYWDMALLKVTGLPVTAKPLKLSVDPPESLDGKDLVVVGYPAQDYRNPIDVQDRVFQGQYGVKRMQPGKARPSQKIQSFENLVNAMTHDASTLGGNSGSAMIDVRTGAVVGLHFAGEYLKANYAVPTYELARDRRVVDAGLNFQGSVPASSLTDGAWAAAQRGVEASPPPTPAPASPQPTPAGDATANFVIPLHVSVSFGTPTIAGTVSVRAGADAGLVPADAGVEKVPVIFPDMEARAGYRDDFLDFANGARVPMPALTGAGKAVAAKLDDGTHVLKYHKFSVVIHKKRRLALFTAANVDWRPESRMANGRKPSRKELDGFTGTEREDWITDSRIPFDHQLPDYFYTRDGGAFDKGHLVRRDDVAWGDSFEDMQKGNGDTFHTTNCSPQTAGFNRSNAGEFNWGALENMVQKQTRAEKVCVFSGPIFADDDRFFHGLVKSRAPVSVQIPRRFWKIIVTRQNGAPAAFGFVLDQNLAEVDLYAELIVPDAWKRFMRPISEIEAGLNGLAHLTEFKAWDQFH